MRPYLVIILLAGAVSINNIHAQQDSNVVNQKLLIAEDIISRIPGDVNNSKVILTGAINTSYRKVRFLKGFAFTGLNFYGESIDSVLVEKLNKAKKQTGRIILESSLDIASRQMTIKSTSLFNRDSCTSCTKIYFEIGLPVEGWEILDIFAINREVKKTDYAYFADDFYADRISIPVFVYSKINGKEKREQFIYYYQLEDNYGYKYLNKQFQY